MTKWLQLWQTGDVHKESQRLIHSVKSIREASMRETVLAERLREHPLANTFVAMEELIHRGGQGNLDVSVALSALVSILEPPSKLSYETRADLYALANERGAMELAYVLLEGVATESKEVEDKPRAIVPNGPVLSLGARKSIARTRDRSRLLPLIHDPNLQVIEILLSNPNLIESDVVVMASKRPADPVGLRLISAHPKWSQPRSVRYALVLNPGCPLPLACRLSLDLRNSDLREIRRNASSPALLRGHAERLLKKREASAGA
ncbi:MAG: hypothetical protein JKY56_14975 [Kofleriaceae bacterium]|nr:hypothetical protein [Kofleriaceae bacterium]